MPQVCTVCTHPARHAIDTSVCVGSASVRLLARQHGLTEAALRRHKEAHLPEALVKGQEAREEIQALDTVSQLKAVNGCTLAILKEARDTKDHELALKAIARVEKQIELQARLLGAIQDGGTTVNIVVHPQWVTLRGAIVTSLAGFPEALDAVVQAIAAAEGV